MKKTTQSDLKRFKAEFERWQSLLGLTQYQVYFFIKDLEDTFAQIEIQEMQKVVSVFIQSELSGQDYESKEWSKTALHECLHLLLHRIEWLGNCRYIESNDLHEENEAIVVRLQKVLYGN